MTVRLNKTDRIDEASNFLTTLYSFSLHGHFGNSLDDAHDSCNRYEFGTNFDDKRTLNYAQNMVNNMFKIRIEKCYGGVINLSGVPNPRTPSCPASTTAYQ